MQNSAENREPTPMVVIRGSHPEKHELRQISIEDNPAPEFDYYKATIHAVEASVIIRELQKIYPLASLRQTGGKSGYDRSVQLCAGDSVLTTVRWSSNGKNKGTNVDTPGAESGTVRNALQCFEHNVRRADIRIDYVEDGMFDYLSAFLIRHAQQHNITINQQGDWARGKARTLYIGSRQSAAMIRLYEKGHKEGGNPFWVRLEFEFKPQKQTGYACAKLTPVEYLGLIQWIRIALDELGIHYESEGTKIGTQRKPENSARARLTLTAQYAKVLQGWMSECNSADEFCSAMVEAIYLQEQHKGEPDHYKKQAIYLDLLDLVEGKPGATGRRHQADDRALTVRSALSELQENNYNTTLEPAS